MNPMDALARQSAFAAHLRDPGSHASPPGIDPARLAVYRDLFFNNVEGLLASFFPVLRSLYEQDDWRALVRAFYAGHRARTPYFLEIAGEFVGFLETGHEPRPVDPPFLLELARYEWLEVVLDVSDEEIPAAGIAAQGDLVRGVPVINPLAVLARHEWPVHRVAPANPRPGPEETWLLVWRDRGDKVRFQELNAWSAGLFMRLRDNAGSANGEPGETVVQTFLEAMPGTVDPGVIEGARQLLESWRTRDVVLGAKGR